jgi:hypothetical protein
MAKFANETRGLKIRGSNFVYLTEGAYSVIFVDIARERIRKVYRLQAGLTRQHCKEVFDSEIEAYKIAGKASDLKTLVPQFYGTCSTAIIVDGQDQDVSREFLGDLAFEAEYIPGDFIKFGPIDPAEQHRITALLSKHGIKHVCDLSACITEGKVTKIVDFATRWIEPRHEDF